MTRIARLLALVLPLCFALHARAALVDDLNAARDAAHVGNLNKLSDLATHIDGTALEMYPRYWLIAAQIDQMPEQQIAAFLDRYAGSVMADRLRADWLRSLGKRGQWDTFEREWPKLVQWESGSDLACYRLQLANVRHDTAMLEREGKPLWFTDKGLPDPCAPVFDALIDQGLLSEDDVWTRIRLALTANNPDFASLLLARLSHPNGIDAKKIQAVATKPIKAIPSLNLSTRGGRELAIFAVLHAAHTSLDAGEALLPQVSHLPQVDRQYLASALGVLAIRKLDDRALGWFQSGLPVRDLTTDQRGSYARAALRKQDWRTVAQVIDAMPADESTQPTWRYWRARAWGQEGNTIQAGKLYASLANEQSFYGLLAREDQGPVVDMTAGHYKPNREELEQVRSIPSVERALALFAMDWRLEAVREWNWGMRGLTDQQLLAAAEVARQAEWYDRAIYSAERTRDIHDFSLRYLAPYRDITAEYAKNLGLDEAWVYGLIRQESRFVTVAKSGVGAHGLMQLMPATARWVARKMGTGYNPSAVNEVGTNIQLGTFYLKHVLDSLGNQPVLATAAYNAGPGRARAWRSDRPLEGAIYAETIPFTETRDYVKKVMANAIYYARAFGQGETSLTRRLGTIAPRGVAETVDDTP
ncbi:MAG: lytic transglycosylase domain-containing protein [Burkholderiales bacterium]|nr:lytic transglycosylase domain-containing protein [Burkholderiales bacterium]